VKLTVLVENSTIIDQYYIAEPAVSYYIETADKKILFDTGYSNIILQNAQAMGVNLLELDYIALSHGHNDHTGGLKALNELYSKYPQKHKPVIIAHPRVFEHKEFNGEYIGSPLTQSELKNNFNFNLTSKPFYITKNLIFLGQIPRLNNFENTEPIGKCMIHGELIDDYVIDDSALAYCKNDNLAIITGCSHSGICNIIQYAKQITQKENIIDIIGGFHLIAPNKTQAVGTIEFFKQYKIPKMHPSHCTSLKYTIKLSQFSTIKEVGVGLELYY